MTTYMRAIQFLLILSFALPACKKDGGYHDSSDANKKVPLNTYDYLKSRPGVFDSLVAVVDKLGLKETLMDSSITLFAVTNQSFQLAVTNLNRLRKQSDKDPLYLAIVDRQQLDTMVSYYIIRGKYLSDSLQLQDGLDLFSVRSGYPMHAKSSRASASGFEKGGPEVIDFSNTKRSKFVRFWSTTTTGSNNIETTNGVVHVVTPDHIFGFDEFVKRLTFVPPPPDLIKLIGGKLTVLRDNNGGPDNGEGSKKVIDGDDHTKFLCEFQGRVWMKFELNEPAVSSVYTLTSANDAPDRDPRAWTFEGSNDDVNWDELDRKFNFFFEQRYQLKVFPFPNTQAYKYYRINFSEVNGSSLYQQAEWTINKAK